MGNISKSKSCIIGIMLILLLAACSNGKIDNDNTSSAFTSFEVASKGTIVSTDSMPQIELSDVSSNEQASSNTATSISDNQSSLNNKPVSEHSSSNAVSSETINFSTPYIPTIYPPSSFRPTSDNRSTFLNGMITPISYVDFMIGDSVDFNAETIIEYSLRSKGGEWYSHKAIIRSYDELKDIHSGEEFNSYYEGNNYPEMYPEEVFEDNMLIMLFVKRNSRDFKYSIDKVTRDESRIYIHMDNVKLPNEKKYYKSETKFRTFITVLKEDMEDITDIVVCDE